MTKAEQQYWITKLPKVLFLQIQRVVFDKTIKKTKKITNPIKFDKTIYLDRFMLENKTLVELGRGGADKYKEKIKKLKEGLQNYLSFGEEKNDLRKCLKTTIEYIRSQEQDEMALVDVYENTDVVYDPRGLGVIKNAESVATMLEQNLQLINQQIETMEKTLAEYEALVAKYEGMTKYRYDLHSILMHSGGPDCGHYYSFIYDAGKHKWRKYNDENITEETEENVFKEAIGDGKHPASAYFLIYVARNKEFQDKAAARDFALSASKLVHEGSREIINFYTTILPAELKREVCEDNLRLDTDIMEERAGWICSQALELYNKRHQKLMLNKKFKGYQEWNFVAYLEDLKIQHYKYFLLDSIIAELNEGSINLDVLDEYDPIYKSLNGVFMKQCLLPPVSLKLQEAEKNQADSREKTFRKTIIDKKLQQCILTKLIGKDWNSALDGIEYYLSNCMFSDTANKKIVEDILRLVILRLITVTTQHVMNKSTHDAITVLKYISQRCVPYLDPEDPHTIHAKRYLTFVFKESASIFISEENVDSANELKNMGTHKLAEVKQIQPTPVLFDRFLLV